MWVAESFRSLGLLLGFVNDRRLPIERAKVVVSREEGGAEVFHLLYEPVDEPERALAAVAAAEAELPDEVEAEDVVDEAEAIIHDAQRDD
jgi:hypothetical protein